MCNLHSHKQPHIINIFIKSVQEKPTFRALIVLKILKDSRFDTSIYGDQYESHSAFCVTLFAYTAYFVGCGQQKSLFHTDLTPYENLVVSVL